MQLVVTAHKMEIVTSGNYTCLDTVLTTDASNYFLLTDHNLAIPCTITANDTFNLVAPYLGDWKLPDNVNKCPTVSSIVLHTALSHYTVIPTLKELLVTKPLEVVNYELVRQLRESKVRQNARNREESKEASIRRGNIVL